MIQKKIFVSLISVIILLAAIVCLSGCAKGKDRKYMLGGVFDVKPPKPDVVMVAVLPVQNATFHPIRMTGKPGALSEFLEGFLSRSLHFKYNENDVAYVQKSLQLVLTQRLYNSGYRMLSPQEVYAAFAALGLKESETGLNVEDITPSIAADWLLLVNLTEWDGDHFELKGKGKAAYEAVLVDTRLKKAIWQKSEKPFNFYAPERHLPYNRQGGETLNLIAKRILQKFPKPAKIMDYKAQETQVSSPQLAVSSSSK